MDVIVVWLFACFYAIMLLTEQNMHVETSLPYHVHVYVHVPYILI